MSRELTTTDLDKAKLLIEFIHVTKSGMVKPFDPSYFLKKLSALEEQGIDIKGMGSCCPTEWEINDAKDFKPYIKAALREFSRIMSLKVNYNE